MTVSELIRQSAAVLFDRLDRPAARLDVEMLLAHSVSRPVSWLYAHADEPLAPSEVDRFRGLIGRLAAGEPLEYLIGRAGFHRIELEVSPFVLVPRPETEILVEAAIDTLRGSPRPLVADAGTGSGAIALAIASALPNARVVALDLSRPALQVAARNVQALGLEDRVALVNGDLLDCVAAQFDLVAANLPYVATGDLVGPSAGVGRYEPLLALDGGPDGLDVVRRLLSQLRRVVRPGGSALLEIGAAQGAAALELAHVSVPGAAASVERDQWDRDRMLALRFVG